MKEENLTVDDVMRAGGCPSGIRRWFTARKDDLPEWMTMRRFLDQGFPLDVVRDLDDAFLNRALELKERGNGR